MSVSTGAPLKSGSQTHRGRKADELPAAPILARHTELGAVAYGLPSKSHNRINNREYYIKAVMRHLPLFSAYIGRKFSRQNMRETG